MARTDASSQAPSWGGGDSVPEELRAARHQEPHHGVCDSRAGDSPHQAHAQQHLPAADGGNPPQAHQVEPPDDVAIKLSKQKESSPRVHCQICQRATSRRRPTNKKSCPGPPRNTGTEEFLRCHRSNQKSPRRAMNCSHSRHGRELPHFAER